MEKRTIITSRDSAREVIAYLEGKFLEKEIEVAIENDLDSTESAKSQTAWNRANKICVGYFKQHLTADNSDATSDFTARKIKAYLEEKYVLKRDQTSFHDAVHNITHLTVYANDSRDKALDKINRMESSVGAINHLANDSIGKLGESLKVALVLNMLPDSFGVLRQSYLEREISSDTYSSQTIKASIESIYCQFSRKPANQSQQQQQSSRTNKDTQSSSQNRNRRDGSPGDVQSFCLECGKPGKHNPCRASKWDKRKHLEHMKDKAKAEKFSAKLSAFKKRPTSASSSSSNSSIESFKAAACKFRVNRVALNVGQILLDSGTTGHLSASLDSLINVKKLEKPIVLDLAANFSPKKHQDVTSPEVTHVGELHLVSTSSKRSVVLSEVYWGPTVSVDLVAVSVWDKLGYELRTRNGMTEVYDSSDVLVCRAHLRNGVYSLDLVPIVKPKHIPNKALASLEDAMLWHIRLGHINWKDLSSLLEVTSDMPLIKLNKNKPMCLSCQAGKQSALPIPGVTDKVSHRPLELVHTDLCGPFLPSLGGSTYYVSFIDDFSRSSTLYFVKEKSMVFQVAKEFKAESELETGRKWLRWRPDNAGKLTSSEFESFMTEHGIQYDTPPAHTPAFFENNFPTTETLDKISVLESDVGLSAEAGMLVPPKRFGPDPPSKYQMRLMKSQAKKGNRRPLQAFKVQLDNDAASSSSTPVCLMDFDAIGSPTSRKAAMSSVFKQQWLKAEQAELDNMLSRKVFRDVQLPRGSSPISLKWVYKISLKDPNATDPEIRYSFKARLVARGDQQCEDTFEDTYAPVSKMVSIRLLIALAVKHGLDVRQWDFIAALLNAASKTDKIYCRLPPGYRSDDPSHVWQALQAIYGLKQSAHEWNSDMNDALISIGWTRLHSDHAVYIHTNGSLLAIWVDDCILACKPGTQTKMFQDLSSKFALKDLGRISKCLGMEFHVNLEKRSIAVNQEVYVKAILEEFNMVDSKTRSTPFAPGTKLSKDGSPAPSSFPYRRIVGKLMYLMNATRPDIAHAVIQLSRYTACPTEVHVESCMHLLRHLNGTRSLGLLYQDSSAALMGFSDSDWGGDADTNRSTTGYLFTMSGSPISWMSKLQPTTALSSTEAEYMAAAEAVKETLWLSSILGEFQPGVKDSLTLHMDNKGAIDLTKHAKYHGRTKHISLRHHFLRETVQLGLVKIEWISTDRMIADCLTKSVSSLIFQRNVAAMGLGCP